MLKIQIHIKWKKIIILLLYLSLQKALKNVYNANIDLPNSTINSNINIPYRFRKSTSMEHYYDKPTHVPNYQKKTYRTDSMGFLNHAEILGNFTINYSQFPYSSSIYFEPISKIRVFSEKYHFISYIDIF